MPTPDFIVDLRSRVGHDLLWLMGAAVFIHREGPEGTEVLLVRRADSGEWALVSGIVDPGENPAVTVVREAKEEADVVIEVERMLWLVAQEPMTYGNGDRCQYLDHGFRARWVSGDPRPADGEASETAWFPVDALPARAHPHLADQVRTALADPADVVYSYTGGLE